MRPRRYAFFDVDDTLIALKSMFDFFPFWCAESGALELEQRFDHVFREARAAGRRREDLNRLYYGFFRGVPLTRLEWAGQAWFQQRFKQGRPPYVAATLERLREHQAEGVTPVFVSGSMLPLLRPIARDLGVAHCLCSRLLTDDTGVLTGEIGEPQTIGCGKAAAIVAFLRKQGARSGDCYAYGDDLSDLPMLEVVGRPVAVGTASLASLAAERGWARLPA